MFESATSVEVTWTSPAESSCLAAQLLLVDNAARQVEEREGDHRRDHHVAAVEGVPRQVTELPHTIFTYFECLPPPLTYKLNVVQTLLPPPQS